MPSSLHVCPWLSVDSSTTKRSDTSLLSKVEILLLPRPRSATDFCCCAGWRLLEETASLHDVQWRFQEIFHLEKPKFSISRQLNRASPPPRSQEMKAEVSGNAPPPLRCQAQFCPQFLTLLRIPTPPLLNILRPENAVLGEASSSARSEDLAIASPKPRKRDLSLSFTTPVRQDCSAQSPQPVGKDSARS